MPELRTPLTSVLGFSRLIKEQPELSTNTRRFVDRVMNAGAALLAGCQSGAARATPLRMPIGVQTYVVRDTIGKFLILDEASWVADSGRFHQAITKGTLNEVEPVGSALVNLDSITDAFLWIFPPPRGQK